jgi:hypothetical protein
MVAAGTEAAPQLYLVTGVTSEYAWLRSKNLQKERRGAPVCAPFWEDTRVLPYKKCALTAKGIRTNHKSPDHEKVAAPDGPPVKAALTHLDTARLAVILKIRCPPPM